MIDSCISVLYLECWCVNVLVFDYCHKDAITGTYGFIIIVLIVIPDGFSVK